MNFLPFSFIKSLQIPVVHCAKDGQFPGVYQSSLLSNPWLSDGQTIVFSSIWHSCQVILSVNVSSGEVLRISPADSNFSWKLLALDGDNVIDGNNINCCFSKDRKLDLLYYDK